MNAKKLAEEAKAADKAKTAAALKKTIGFKGKKGGNIGKPVQVDPIKPTLKAPGIKRLKLKHDKPLSNVAFKFNLHRYTSASRTGGSTGTNPCRWTSSSLCRRPRRMQGRRRRPPPVFPRTLSLAACE